MLSIVKNLLICFACAEFAVICVTGQPSDLLPEALEPRTSGEDVVRNVNENIRNTNIFPDDHGFMDNLACTESNFGTHPDTYRDGYHGGVFQVDEIGYLDTKDIVSHPGLKRKHDMIMNELGIDWMSTTWEDLEKPLYSGVGARLYISNNPEPIPTTKDEQGIYWKENYNTGSGAGDPNNFGKREANLGSSNKDVNDFYNCASCHCSELYNIIVSLSPCRLVRILFGQKILGGGGGLTCYGTWEV